ncbi:MAG: GNAT family N-acetyltransferase [Saprospiraceae bacterium]|nr:GNAT family N-acetyltransferase [Saprospiraceae bacterium]
MIRPATAEDAIQITDIYNYYIQHTTVTFEKTPVAVQEMEDRIIKTQIKYPWLVCQTDNLISGYAYATDWKPRGAYRHSVESTVYLRNGCSGQGIGSLLYTDLIQRLKKQKVHTVIGGIAQPNEGSIALHEKFGFKKVAHFKEVGYKFDSWVDVAYWQLIL